MKFYAAGKMHSLLYLLALAAVTPNLAFATTDHDTGPQQPRFTLASVCGNYGAIATYGANIARALGTETMDGRGNITGAAIVNQPGPNGTRTIVSIGIGGTYTIKPDGTGTMVLTIALPDGSTASVTEDFLITKSATVDGVPIATEMQDAQEVPSAVIEDSSLVIHTYTLGGVPRSCSTER